MTVATAKRSIAAKVDERALSGKCLHCETSSDVRGLCYRHYIKYMRLLTAKPENERAAFDAKQIHEGKILSSGYIRVLKSDNPFAEV